MRKYQQLLLVIISVFSLTLLLVYRHEYNRLHYVLQVLNFFGQPCNFSELIESGNILNHHDWGPDPLWNQEDTIFVYSTHLTQQQELQSLVVKSQTAEHSRNCFLWFEDDSEWKPEVGRFKFSKLFTDHINNYEGYQYVCSWTRKSIPFAVSYSKRDMVKHLIVQNHNVSSKFNFTMCVPPTKFLTKRYLTEFVSFHNLLGVDSFIVYSNDIPHKTTKLVSNLSRQLHFNISFYSYNFPHYFEEIISEDCRLRTLSQSKFSTVMEVNEYLVPSQTNLFDALYTKSDRLKLPVQKFCINEQLPREPIAIQNLHSIRDDEKLTKIVNVHLYNKNNNVISESGATGGLISIHKYIFCLDQITKTYLDDSILKYADNFIKTTLFQMNLHDLL